MSVQIGNDIATNEAVIIGDIQRRSGIYILGKPGFGKTNILKVMLEQDIKNGHGIFFIDPHGDAIEELVYTKAFRFQFHEDTIFLDPELEEDAFGINLLSCKDPSNLKERIDTYNRAYKIFYRLW
jgi:energy-coupling factor transporter ATP-binding protein EcfA2